MGGGWGSIPLFPGVRLVNLELILPANWTKRHVVTQKKTWHLPKPIKCELKGCLLSRGCVTHLYRLLVEETGDCLMHSSFWSTKVPNCTYLDHIALRLLLFESKPYWINQMHVGCKPRNQKPHTTSRERCRISLFLTCLEKKGTS